MQSSLAQSPPRVVAERLARMSPRLPDALLALIRVVSRAVPQSPLRFAGVPPRPIEISRDAIADYLDEVTVARYSGVPMAFLLADRDTEPTFILAFDIEPNQVGHLEYAWFPLPTSLYDAAPTASSVATLLDQVGVAFGAFLCRVESDALMTLYRAQRATERALAAVPANLRQYVPKPETPTGAAARVPGLLVPQEFDRRRVPDGIWWVQRWDAVQVETLGRTRIMSADWTQVIPVKNDALVLVTTEAPLDPENPDHAARLRRIIEQLDLRATQEAYRNNSQDR